MSILIKGVEMPKSRGVYELRMFVDSDGTATVEGAYCRFEGEPFSVVPVPPHGRLIDADALGKVMSEGIAPSVKDGGFKHPFDIIRAVADAPTIIPADSAEEEDE